MRVLFLGTGAAEGYPAIFCECAHCTTARARGGRNLRRRSALLVNDDLLIDMGPDLVASMHATGTNLGRVANMLITHSHGDHFHLANLYMRRSNFAPRHPRRWRSMALLPQWKRLILRPMSATYPKRSFICVSTLSGPAIPGRRDGIG